MDRRERTPDPGSRESAGGAGWPADVIIVAIGRRVETGVYVKAAFPRAAKD
jgi:hypothetical protein